jgi:hypothetical protein
MKVALICPPALLERYGRLTHYHLVLPHLLESKKYSDFYRERRANGDFIILDNGAAEGLEYGPRHLHRLAKEVEANEIVVPDTLGDYLDTISKAKAFVPYADPDFKYMAVIQGSTMEEVLKCLYYITSAPDMMYITSLGLPRVLNTIDHHFRAILASTIIREGIHEKFQIHFLGYSKWIREVTSLANIAEGHEAPHWDAPGFRGIDTSMPIYMGLAGRYILENNYVERPDNYFDITHDRYEQVMANINAFLIWANEKPIIPSQDKYGKEAPTS